MPTKQRAIRDADKQFSTDYTLLGQGRYREWFWQGLDETQRNFLRAPVAVPTAPPADNYMINWTSDQGKHWYAKAACKDADPVVFFSEGEGVDPKREYLKPDAEWRQYCPQCPVREQCLQLARDSESVGIFGGKIFSYDYKAGFKEYDETNVPRRGRPPKAKSFARMKDSEREEYWKEMQKEIDDRIAAAAARESLGDQ